jgi:hypothetical protein
MSAAHHSSSYILVTPPKVEELSSPLEKRNFLASQSIYEPLTENEIRLVQLHPGSKKEPIHCSLTTHLQVRAPSYEALSYVWGSQEQPAEITLEQKAFKITKNLEQALLQLRSADNDRILWIDALVINQSDLAERNIQVQQMRTIYASASTVLMWLGQPRDPHEFDSMFEIFKLPSGCHSISAAVLCHLYDIGRLEYFSRAWVYQEIAYARHVLVLIGHHSVHYSILDTLWTSATTSHEGEDLIIAGLKHTLRRIGIKAFIKPGCARSSGYYHHTNWLKIVMSLHCHDPRDLIFAFYGCFSPRLRNRLLVDYSKSLEDVCYQATRAIIETSGDLTIIIWNNKGPRSASYPTWVARIDTKRKAGALVTDNCPELIKASRGQFSFKATGRILKVKGILLGVITEVGSPFHDHRSVFGSDCSNCEASRCLFEHLSETWSIISQNSNQMPSIRFVDTATFGIIRELGELRDRVRNLLSRLYMELSNGYETDHFANYDDIFKGLITIENEFHAMHYGRLMFSFVPRSETSAIGNHRIMSRERLSFGIGSHTIARGDVICLLLGCSGPVVLRQQENGYQVICGVTVLGEVMSDAIRHLSVQKFFLI